MLISLILNATDKRLAFLEIIAYALTAMVAIVMHELSHGYIAYRQGDDTARLSGRLTLNPLKHLDLMGTLMLLFVGFGWAKPVPVNPLNFKEYRKGMRKVSLAGVTMNFILGVLGIAFFAIYVAATKNVLVELYSAKYYIIMFVQYLLIYSMSINFILMVFNLIPLYPLDGFRLLETFTKPNNKYIEFNYRYGNYTLLGFLLVNFLCSTLFGVSLFSWVSGLLQKILMLIQTGILG